METSKQDLSMTGRGGGDLSLSIRSVEGHTRADGKLDVVINSSRGDILGILHAVEGQEGAVVWVGGALGGFSGPGGLYQDLGDDLVSAGISSLRLHYRLPDAFEECVLDVLAGVSFLKGIGATKVVLAGHSFGGAVAIAAGTYSPLVAGVVALSSQTHGATAVVNLKAPLLLVHGLNDTRLAPRCSRLIYEWAPEPKPELVLYPGAGHGLRECYQELRTLLKGWISQRLGVMI